METVCPIEEILVRLSSKWTLLILRHLESNGKCRFNGFLNALNGISPRTLSKRLKELEKLTLISKRRFNETPPRVEYRLTPKGRGLIKCFASLNAWVTKFHAF
ncbi:MAG: winged helix-turn-helix transcriptional regulator [Candidatus Micrarchaeia archaeon]